MPHNPRPQLSRSQRCAHVAREYLRGRTQAEISRELGISVATVCRDLQKCEQIWLRSMEEDTAKRKARMLAKIRIEEREAWSEYERSKLPIEVRRSTRARTPPTDAPASEQVEPAQFDAEGVITNPPAQSPEPTRASSMTEVQAVEETRSRIGDVRFLAEIRACREQEIELFGLNIPQEINIAAEIKAKREEYRKLPTEELYRLHRERLALLPKPNGSSNP